MKKLILAFMFIMTGNLYAVTLGTTKDNALRQEVELIKISTQANQGDNFGSHIATKNIDMGGYDLTNAYNVASSSVNTTYLFTRGIGVYGNQPNGSFFMGNQVGVWSDLYPISDITYDLGFNTPYRFRGIYAQYFYGDGSNLTGIAGVYDNLGNHVATTTLNMNGYGIVGATSAVLGDATARTINIPDDVSGFEIIAPGIYATGNSRTDGNLQNNSIVSLTGQNDIKIASSVVITQGGLTVSTATIPLICITTMTTQDASGAIWVSSGLMPSASGLNLGGAQGRWRNFTGETISLSGLSTTNGYGLNSSGQPLGGVLQPALIYTLEMRAGLGRHDIKISSNISASPFSLTIGSVTATKVEASTIGVASTKLYGDGSSISGLLSAGDNFGSHIATQPIDMNGYAINKTTEVIFNTNDIIIKANSSASVSMGYASIVTGQGSVAIGYNNSGTSGVSLGYGNTGNTSGVGIGNSCFGNSNGVGIGNTSKNNTIGGIGIGYGACSNDTYGIGIGSGAYSNSVSGIGIGYNAYNNNKYGVGIGAYSTDNSNYAVGIGAYSHASSSSVAIGAYSTCLGSQSVSLGGNTSNTADRSVAIGYGCENHSSDTVKIQAGYTLLVDTITCPQIFTSTIIYTDGTTCNSNAIRTTYSESSIVKYEQKEWNNGSGSYYISTSSEIVPYNCSSLKLVFVSCRNNFLMESKWSYDVWATSFTIYNNNGVYTGAFDWIAKGQ